MGGTLALLNPDLFDDADMEVPENDPRKKLIRAAQLQTLGAGTDADEQSSPDTIPTPPSSGRTDADSRDPNSLNSIGDMEPLPSSQPATPAKSAAASRLQRAQQPFQSQGIAHDLIRGLLTAAPAAIGGGRGAAGAVAGANTAYERNIAERQQAAQQYEFEAGREERERDQAIKERVAQAQIQSQRAYRTLMVAAARRRGDISQQNADTAGQRADTAEGTAAVNAASKALTVSKGPDGVTKVTPIAANGLDVINQAKLGVAQATEELKRAQATAIPEQVEIAKRRVDNQSRMLQKALAQFSLQQDEAKRKELTFNAQYGLTKEGGPSDVPQRIPGALADNEGTALPLKVAAQAGPSGQEKSRGGAAQNVMETAHETADLIRANKKVLGPIWGRVSIATLAAGGSPDFVMTPEQKKALAEISTSLQSTYSFASAAHGWRSLEAPREFEKAVGGLARDPEMTASGLEKLASNMTHVVKRGSTARVPATSAVSRLQKTSPSSPAPVPANAPAAATPARKVRSWKEFVAQ